MISSQKQKTLRITTFSTDYSFFLCMYHENWIHNEMIKQLRFNNPLIWGIHQIYNPILTNYVTNNII